MNEPMTREECIAAHRGLCRSIAQRFLRPGLERADLEQVAVVGLIKAVDCFNPAFGTPLVAFARRRIIGELMHYVRDHESIVRFPRAIREMNRREQKAQTALQIALGRNPTIAEIAEFLGCAIDDVTALHDARYRCNTADLELVRDIPAAGESVEERALIYSSFRRLESDEHALIMGVYGLRLSQTEAGLRLGYTQRSASRLHRRALHKLSLVLGEA